ncbi:MAG: TIGR03936 family radical SAM-associated protein [Treponema sp.]|jgi:radical SAM-linked protein|nr:TIGR03936 family radical SAM-associated protein [Treponema sp.]
MSNQALRILYNNLNGIEGVSCDRAFAPAPDFEALLRGRDLPLYGLDTGLSLRDADLLLFTLGYELGITGVLTMLDVSGIPIRADERTEEHPIVIMGGPCVSNPRPYERFIDVFWIGEAEAGFFDLVRELLALKKRGEGRGGLLDRLCAHESIWARGKGAAVRAVDWNFPSRKTEAPVFPIPSLKIVQQHGALEIMRGCPNGCRFCHAGYWYRPMRQKSADLVIREAEAFIRKGGYREISLSSLSSGDYRGIDSLVERLNRRFSHERISFQLPSLRVSSFSLPLLEKISEVRKSGLTFAVETPVDAWQFAINKDVFKDQVIAILSEARKNGWRGAKFYFMVGLPIKSPEGTVPDDAYREIEDHIEEEKIVNFIKDVARMTGSHFNINVGTFVPKPHTPFQWAAQIDEETSRGKLDYIRSRLRPLGHKVGIQDPFTSLLEGVLSRGDERVGGIVEEAFLSGCRLDAWSEYLKKDIWRYLFSKNQALIWEITGPKKIGETLPWEVIESGVSQIFLRNEHAGSVNREITSPCIKNCNHNCGICDVEGKIVENIIHDNNLLYDTEGALREDLSAPAGGMPPGQGVLDDVYDNRYMVKENIIPRKAAIHDDSPPESRSGGKDPVTCRIIFSFTKLREAVFLSHLSVIEIFAMAFLRAGIPVSFSRGFNPLPKLEIASPVALGIFSSGEIAAVDTDRYLEAHEFVQRMNGELPQGIGIMNAMNIEIRSGAKKHSLSSRLWGFAYSRDSPQNPALKDTDKIDYIKTADDKTYREAYSAATEGASVYGLRRIAVLARPPDTVYPDRGISYFEAYRELYPED